MQEQGLLAQSKDQLAQKKEQPLQKQAQLSLFWTWPLVMAVERPWQQFSLTTFPGSIIARIALPPLC
ncbi:MAG: hypothetical protein R6W06_10915 [Prochlorococcaceae cyanobacterium]